MKKKINSGGTPRETSNPTEKRNFATGGTPVKDICFTSIFAVLTAVFAQIAVPLPFSPLVPLSLGIVAVYSAAILLPPRCAIMSQICYLLLGAVGLPVFGGFMGGMSRLLGPTGGYLMVYPIMAAIISFALNSNYAMQNETKKKTFIRGTVSIVFSHLLLYVGGTVWLSISTGTTFIATLASAVFPFIPLDIVKVVFCILVIIPLRKRFMSMGLLNLNVTRKS
ncbi:MAG: biotin transporter BioY [Oscillospiraceae bacterium]|nr:biotin transporter BioY [Oscillospiraceae bacterium]